jgi:hypothetical protein
MTTSERITSAPLRALRFLLDVHVGRLAADLLFRLNGIADRHHIISARLQQLSHERRDVRIIIDDKDARRPPAQGKLGHRLREDEWG